MKGNKIMKYENRFCPECGTYAKGENHCPKCNYFVDYSWVDEKKALRLINKAIKRGEIDPYSPHLQSDMATYLMIRQYEIAKPQYKYRYRTQKDPLTSLADIGFGVSIAKSIAKPFIDLSKKY